MINNGQEAKRSMLKGLKVIEFGQIAAAPFTGSLLADLGADVVKIEKPKEGDPARNLGYRVGNNSSYFISVNRGKKSITLDISSEIKGSTSGK